ncbi:MAG: DinB family protein [Terriglobales bacterium]
MGARDMLGYLREMFQYDDWANHETLHSLQEMEHPPERARKIMAHIVAAELLWMARLQQGTQKTPVWPEFGLDDCERQLAELRQGWELYLAGLADGDLNGKIAYTNSKGENYSNEVRDILMHVLMHGTYHRGQIAAAVRDRAGEPAYTDFIEAVRKGKLSAAVSSEL